MAKHQDVGAETPLHKCPEKRIGLSLPGPISERLDELVSVAEEAGERTTRKELIACLILASPTTGQGVSELLRALRLARARDAQLGDAQQPTVAVRSHRPGPRPRTPRAS